MTPEELRTCDGSEEGRRLCLAVRYVAHVSFARSIVGAQDIIADATCIVIITHKLDSLLMRVALSMLVAVGPSSMCPKALTSMDQVTGSTTVVRHT